jgi:hypothetical protein
MQRPRSRQCVGGVELRQISLCLIRAGERRFLLPNRRRGPSAKNGRQRGVAVEWGMALEGEVRTFPLGELFAWLARSRATGVLTLTRGMTIRRFHLRAGAIRLVSSSEQEMLLGQLLVERALVTPETLTKALARRTRSRARLGRLLMRGALVASGELEAILAEKVRRLLADALTWSEGRFFYEAAARRPRPREIAVTVDLKAALEQIQTGVMVDDSDVIESLPASRE